MEIKPEMLPLRIPLTDRPVIHGGIEYQSNYEDISKELRGKIEGIDESSVLVQVNINDTGIAFVFEDIL